jgi:hypothetical protein
MTETETLTLAPVLSLADARALATSGAVSARASAFIHAVNNKGAFIEKITMNTVVKTNAATTKAGTIVTKVQTISGGITTGTSYANQKQNADKETGGLPGTQEWIIFPYITRNADGQEYVRVYVDSRIAKYETEYFVDGVKVGNSKESIKQYLTPSAFNPKPRDENEPIMTIGPKIENVIAINGVIL